MLPSKAKQTLAANLRLLSGGTDTQAFREKTAKRSGGAVSARTIGNMMSESSGNPTLANIEAVAAALGVTPAQLLTENLGQSERGDANHPTPAATLLTVDAARIVERLTQIESSGATSPELLRALHAVLDMASPTAAPGNPSPFGRASAETRDFAPAPHREDAKP